MIQKANQQKLVFAWGVVLLVVRTTNLLSLFVEWVKLFTDKVTRGGVTGYGSGLMQVDSQHFNELARYGIKPEHLTTDPCMNIYTGAYYLAIAFKKWGVTWEAVGAYNAGFRKSERQNQRRLAYASEVYRIYTGIKSSKGIRVPATKKSLPEINSVQNN
ncbi:transglycosylase SLT domain-containing protein [Escherichia coli]|uniref:transglycosylase SLT domain-containing protein n=1 Tax=Escherichia coli TaxID=562 RepID=UPI00288029C2|nr:transglycosylase SLT domain-containing protein [Escherichia coli]